jgi:large subunit ribosomal protein L32
LRFYDRPKFTYGNLPSSGWGKFFVNLLARGWYVLQSAENFKESAMGQPKRKNSKQRSHKRRGAHRFAEPQLSKDRDGTLFMPHHVNPTTGMYRGRQVIEVE